MNKKDDPITKQFSNLEMIFTEMDPENSEMENMGITNEPTNSSIVTVHHDMTLRDSKHIV
jgi:hypothetical protein